MLGRVGGLAVPCGRCALGSTLNLRLPITLRIRASFSPLSGVARTHAQAHAHTQTNKQTEHVHTDSQATQESKK